MSDSVPKTKTENTGSGPLVKDGQLGYIASNVVVWGWVIRASMFDHLAVSHLLMSLAPAVAVRKFGVDSLLFRAMAPFLQGSIGLNTAQVPLLFNEYGAVNRQFDSTSGSAHLHFWKYAQKHTSMDMLLPPTLRSYQAGGAGGDTIASLDMAWGVLYEFMGSIMACDGDAIPSDMNWTQSLQAVFTEEIRLFPLLQAKPAALKNMTGTKDYFQFLWTLVLYHGSFGHYVASDSTYSWLGSLDYVSRYANEVALQTITSISSGTRSINRDYSSESLYSLNTDLAPPSIVERYTCMKTAHAGLKASLDELEVAMRNRYQEGSKSGAPHPKFLVPYPSVVGAGTLY